jgi:gamma-glutamyl:cysteine ligase YbdK (ATP-grasp superfamily)
VPDELVFCRSKEAYTLGVELEFQLVDRDTINLVPRAKDVLTTWCPTAVTGQGRSFFSPLLRSRPASVTVSMTLRSISADQYRL